MIAEKVLGPREFQVALGLAAGQLNNHTGRLLENAHLRYLPVDDAGQETLRAETAEQIANGFTVVGEHRANIWRDAWQEQLDRFERSNFDLKALNPSFVASSPILRWQGDYVIGATEQFELVFFEIIRDWVFRTYLSDINHLYEFGSGSAFNVAAYAQLFPKVSITALDWAPAAVRIAELLREQHGMKISGRRFDFFAPQSELVPENGSGVLTICALEQTGDRFGPFLDYLIASRPRRVVHIEPIIELYDPNSPHDRLAIEYHGQRKYLRGLLPRLMQLESDGIVRLLFKRRLKFGSRFHECFTVIAWEPA